MKPHKFQQELKDKNPSKFLLPWKTGTGKTYATILWSDNDPGRTLLICPKYLKEKWERDLTIAKTEHVIVGKEEFSRNWEKYTGFTSVVIDEAHYFAGMKSGMSKNLLKWIAKNNIKRVALATATPYLSTPWNIYRLATILGIKWNYWEFQNRFFYNVRMGQRMIPVVRKDIEEDVAELVNKISFSTVTLGDIIGDKNIPEQIFKREAFSLTKEQKDGIDIIASEESNPATRYGYIHQITNGSLKGNEFRGDAFYKCNKNERILEYAENNKKLAVFCRYNLQIEDLRQELEKRGKRVIVVNGTVKDKDARILEAESLERCVILINAHCSEGYQLPSFDTVIFASLSFSLKDYTQAIGRFLRYDAIKKNVYIHLVAEGTVDEAVYDSIMKKEDFDIAIYARKKGANI